MQNQVPDIIMILNKYIKVLLVLIISATPLFSQNFVYNYLDKDYESIIDTTELYSFSNVSAFLFHQKYDPRLQIDLNYKTSQGDFRGFTTPEKINHYVIRFSGSKKITENQIFKGEFLFVKDERKSSAWITSKHPHLDFPFLIADSTTGDIRYNNLLLNFEYANKSIKNISIGTRISYLVDEGLKKVFPRPVSSERGLSIETSVAYNKKGFNISLAAAYQDFKEEVKYSEDKGALYKENILFKFRGYDNPIRLNNKTFSWKVERKIIDAKLVTSLKTKKNQIYHLLKFMKGKNEFYEGIEKKFNSGQTTNKGTFTKLLFVHKYNKRSEFQVEANYNFYNSWSKHPDYDIVLSEQERTGYFIGTGYKNKISSRLTIGAQINGIFQKEDFSGYYDKIYYDFKKTYLEPVLSFKYNLNSENRISFMYMLRISVNDEHNLQETEVSNIYKEYLSRDIHYRITKADEHKFLLRWFCNSFDKVDFIVNLSYQYKTSRESPRFNNDNYNTLSCGIDFKIN